jgi:hypothetical protein
MYVFEKLDLLFDKRDWCFCGGTIFVAPQFYHEDIHADKIGFVYHVTITTYYDTHIPLYHESKKTTLDLMAITMTAGFVSVKRDRRTYTKEARKKASGCMRAMSSELSHRILARLAFRSCTSWSAATNVC